MQISFAKLPTRNAVEPIRLIKEGAKLPLFPKDLLGKKMVLKSRFKKGVLKTSLKHAEPTYLRKIARCAKGVLGIQGAKTKNAIFGNSNSNINNDVDSGKKNKRNWGRPIYLGERNAPATHSEIDGVKNVVPWASESTLIKISYPDGKSGRTEGIRLYCGRYSKERVCKEFSFWVYPRSKKKLKKVTLQFLVTDQGKTYFLAVDVKTDMWQRIIMPSGKIAAPIWKDICIVGNPKLPEYKKGNEVSFEFNGFSFLSAPDKSFRYRIIEEKPKAGKKSSLIVLFFALPGKEVEYRHVF